MLNSFPVHAVHELLPSDSCPSRQTHAELSLFGIIPLGHASHAVFPVFGISSPVHAVHEFPSVLTSLSPEHAQVSSIVFAGSPSFKVIPVGHVVMVSSAISRYEFGGEIPGLAGIKGIHRALLLPANPDAQRSMELDLASAAVSAKPI